MHSIVSICPIINLDNVSTLKYLSLGKATKVWIANSIEVCLITLQFKIEYQKMYQKIIYVFRIVNRVGRREKQYQTSFGMSFAEDRRISNLKGDKEQ